MNKNQKTAKFDEESKAMIQNFAKDQVKKPRGLARVPTHESKKKMKEEG